MNSAQKALDQIHVKKYDEMYLNKGKEIVLVGVSFSEAERNIGTWIIEKGEKGEKGDMQEKCKKNTSWAKDKTPITNVGVNLARLSQNTG